MKIKDINVWKFREIRKIMRNTNDDILNTKNGYLTQKQITEMMFNVNKFLSYFPNIEDREKEVSSVIESYVKQLDEILEVNQTKR